MPAPELCFLPAAELVRRYRARELSPVEVVEAVLGRIDRLNPTLNAYCTVAADEARTAAREAEAKLTGGELGPLFGVPVSIKDLTVTKGIRTTRGSLLYKDYVPDFDAPVVERLRAAGAIVLGKTNTPEFGWKGDSGNRVFGPTHNPWKLERTAGGSSGGAAAAVAAGLGPLAQGSDGAGSIRIPASFCGIFGHKPSFGLVPQFPSNAGESLSHVGPMTRTVGDAALMLDVIAGPDDRDRNSIPRTVQSFSAALGGDIKGLRVAWSPDLGYAKVDPEVAHLCAAAARRFADLGCAVEEVSPGFADPYPILQPIYYAAQGGFLKERYADVRNQLDPGLAALIDEGAALTAYDYGEAVLKRVMFWDEVRRFMQPYDLLLTPTLATTAFEAGKDNAEPANGRTGRFIDWTPFSYPFNLTGQPAATVPCGFTSDGLPVGLQIVGRRYDDTTVLRAAAAFEEATPWADRWPEVG